MSRILRLQAENVKRIKAIDISPKDNVVVIGGKNGQGKSSVLDAIMYALAGERNIPAKPLRKGQKAGVIRVDLGETKHGHLFVERTFAESGKSELVIKSKEGYEAPTPQTILNDLCGKLTFDPLEFSRQKPKDQLAILRDLVGLDFSKSDAERAAMFAERTSVNRMVSQLKAELASTPLHTDAPEKEVSVSDLARQLSDAQEHNNAIRVAERNVANLEMARVALEDEITELTNKLTVLKAKLSEAREREEAAVKELDAHEPIDVAPIKAKLDGAEAVNAKVRANQKRAELSERHAAADKKSSELTAAIKAIDSAKAEAIASAKFPVEGLSFGDDGVVFRGVPLEQASSSERIRVSAAIGIALNPDLRVMFIRDGSLLDDDSLAMIAEMATESDTQTWIEKVSVGEEVSVVIEDGMVKEDRTLFAEAAATEEGTR